MHGQEVCSPFDGSVNPGCINIMIRLYVEPALATGTTVEATDGQAHYLGRVMRRAVGDRVQLFNGRDGEWVANITALLRDRAAFKVETLARPQEADTDLWLAFALLKRDSTDMIVQKATELGVAALLPVFTERTNAGRVNLERLRAIAIESAEQSERLTVPEIRAAEGLDDILAGWPTERPLFVAIERAKVRPLAPVAGPAGLLIGPEGGFGPRDHLSMDRSGILRPVSLGRRILRADTAAIVGLALLRGPCCG
jgi:16S rRNA (uracil1498-N3)-methyltransferase